MKGILCFGDSITFGRGEAPAVGWCGRLKTWWESQDDYNAVYNLGIPGDTSHGLLQRLPTELKQRVRMLREGDSFSVVLAIGTNDLAFDGSRNAIPLDVFRENVSSLIASIESTVSPFYVLAIPPVDESQSLNWEDYSYSNADVARYNAVLQEIAGEAFVSLVYSDWSAKLPDGIHPNSVGYSDMFEQIRLLFE